MPSHLQQRAALLLIVFLTFSSFSPATPFQASQWPPKQALLHPLTITPNHGAVASENRVCSQIGIDLLTAGGNAADALVGTLFCVGVLDCHHSGIGGGGFALARSANGTFKTIDFRESAPAAAHEDMFKDNVLGSLFGGLASGVPGELRGSEYIHKKYGRLPWRQVLAPAIALAAEGFEVSEDFAKAMDESEERGGYEFLSKEKVWAVDFAPNGTRVGRGDRITRKRYAKTLKAVALQGVDALYRGWRADAIVETIRKTNGTMTAKDMSEYSIISRDVVGILYRGYRIHASGAPASGSVVLSALKILEGYNLEDTPLSHLNLHRAIEATRFGYGKRASFGDPNYVEGLSAFEADMLSEDFARTTRDRISDAHTLNISFYDPEGFEIKEDHGTSHIVTADASGLAFSLTSTVNIFFGSRVMDPATGVILNNQMNDFSIPNTTNIFGYRPSPNNYARPRARPLSSISPLIVSHPNGTLYAVLGASGGPRIIPTTLQNAISVIDEGIGVKTAIGRKRWHDQLMPNELFLEEGYDEDAAACMSRKGHNVTWKPTAGSSAQLIRVVDGVFEAAGECRQANSAGLTV